MCTRVARVHACAAELGGTVWTRVRVLREDPIWFVARGGVRYPVWWPIRGLSVAYPRPIRGLSVAYPYASVLSLPGLSSPLALSLALDPLPGGCQRGGPRRRCGHRPSRRG